MSGDARVQTKYQIAIAERITKCKKLGVKVLYVDKDSTKIQGMSYDYIIVDEYISLKEMEKWCGKES
jgi:hypothetical protein